MVATLAACVGEAPEPGASTTDDAAPTTTSTVPTTTEPATTSAPSTTSPAPRYVFPLRPAEAAGYSQGHHDYPATDILTPVGTEFLAPTSGTVDWVSRTDPWDPAVDDPASRGGLSVAIVGDDGVRYYGSHLSEVTAGLEPGARVEAGDVLGRTGRSGNAAGTDPHLHFGISHPTTPEDWRVRRGEVDPFPYLGAWGSGEDITPSLPTTRPPP